MSGPKNITKEEKRVREHNRRVQIAAHIQELRSLLFESPPNGDHVSVLKQTVEQMRRLIAETQKTREKRTSEGATFLRSESQPAPSQLQEKKVSEEIPSSDPDLIMTFENSSIPMVAAEDTEEIAFIEPSEKNITFVPPSSEGFSIERSESPKQFVPFYRHPSNSLFSSPSIPISNSNQANRDDSPNPWCGFVWRSAPQTPIPEPITIAINDRITEDFPESTDFTPSHPRPVLGDSSEIGLLDLHQKKKRHISTSIERISPSPLSPSGCGISNFPGEWLDCDPKIAIF